MLCGYFSASTTRTVPFINKQLCQPDLQFQPTVAPLVGQTKAIIISWWIIMNIFLLLKRRFGFRWKIWRADSCAKYPNSQWDMKPTAPESFFTIMNKRLPCLIMERFIVNHRDMWFFSSLVHFEPLGDTSRVDSSRAQFCWLKLFLPR